MSLVDGSTSWNLRTWNVVLYLPMALSKSDRKKGAPKPRVPLPSGEAPPHYSADIPKKLSDITWRIFRIMAEFVEGFEFLSTSQHEISIFGSTQFHAGNVWYEQARALGYMLGKKGHTIVTGGGPGIMEAANRGAYEAGAESLGINIQLPREQRVNPYVTRGRGFHYFFTRKVMLAAAARAYVFFPGGFGTLDEVTELVQLIQTNKMQRIPIILVGKEFWTPLLEWMEKTMVKKYKTVPAADMHIYQLVDTAQEAMEIIRASPDRSFF